MSALRVFTYEGRDIRTVLIEDETWFVATDVARFLGYREASDMARTLDDDEKGSEVVRTPGGPQRMTVLNEQGLYRAAVKRELGFVDDGSRAAVKAFQRWVTHEVLPSIRRTGAYVVPETPEQFMARAVMQAQGIIARKDERIAELAPRAEAWDEIADAGTDYAIRDVAPMLSRAGIETGPQRLFETLHQLGWIYRGEKQRWTPYAKSVDAGYLKVRAMPPYRDRDTGDLVPAAPQVRITPRGIERLRVRLGAGALTP